MEHPHIPGLMTLAEYITPEEEQQLIRIIDEQIWITDLKRRVQHYGFRYDYRARRIDPTMYLGALPEWAQQLAGKLHADAVSPVVPDQLIVNEYQPGQGIARHVDCIPCFGDVIISLSLGSACVMTFTELKTKDEIPVLLAPRSLVVMTGASRYDWQHGIAARMTDVYDGITIPRKRRLSLTFRRVI
jgi:alkylated DNA repair dioxygenase AlkB